MSDETSSPLSRRQFLQNIASTSAIAIGAGVLLAGTACSPPKADKKAAGGDKKAAGGDTKSALSCNDVSGLKDAEKKMRTANQYADKSTKAGQNCLNCNFWQAPKAEGGCGGCQVIKGPIHPEGWCKLWAKKAG